MAAAPDAGDVAALQAATHLDPFAVLGLHRCGPHNGRPSQWALRVLLPGAQAVQVVLAGGAAQPVPRLPGTELFCTTLAADEPPGYRLAVTWADGTPAELEDPYRFAPLLTDVDLWLLAEGTHRRPYERLGAHAVQHQGVAGVRFVLWAPQARRVSVVGDFNGWDGRRHFMRRRPEAGLWEAFVPGLAAGALYKYELLDAHGQLALRADPFAFAAELRPGTASRVWPLPPKAPAHPGRAAANALQAPISIYEVHAGSWRRPGDGRRWLGWRELADTLVPYARDLGFTHLELLPVHEHPFDGSWGYQPTGLYAPTARHGSPDDLRAFVDAAHAAGLGVLLDWVPGHFPSDAFALARFDGSHLYEHADPREGYHPDWNTLIYNFGRVEVRNFLAGNALHWLEHYGVDGLRVDAVASMLYRDYSRRAGEWVPNRHGGRENLEAVAFLRATNHLVGTERPGAIMVAEESTAWPAVTQPPTPDLGGGGLGFHYKWNMGWMNDTLAYFAREPVHRRWHHDQLRFGLMYAWSEHYVLPLSHDEVVHGKRSLLGKMPGDEWQRFANLRALYGWMWGHPGKKLLFMGGELAQPQEWNADAELAWPVLAQPLHAGVQRLVRDLNHVLRHFAALHAWDSRPEGFAWVRHTDAEHSTLAFTRHAPDGGVLLVTANLTPMPRIGWRIGVPRGGRWREVINTDATVYGGSGVGTGLADAQATTCDGHAHSLLVDLPPLAVVMWVPAE